MRWLLCVVAVGIEIGCQAGPQFHTSSTGTLPTSAAATTSSTSAAGGFSSGGISTGSGGTGTAGSSGSTSAGTTGSSTGGTTGNASVDGGYVFCELPGAADAGPSGDGGLANWMCRPGTYTCDLGGDIGNCFQCTTDADCLNHALPTYDPQRPHCDLHSGVPGYQNFCQQCVANTDCADNPAGSLCNLNPTYPPTSSEFPLEIRGFESCGRLLTDCRLDGGPVCNGLNQTCDAATGICVVRSGACVTDQDCAGFDVTAMGDSYFFYFTILPEPYCVAGACNSCPDGGVCGPSACSSDLDCGGAGLTCDTDAGQCGCTSTSSCGGIWPVCEDLGVGLDDDGQAIGFCGCDQDYQCGDAGLVCLQPEMNTVPTVGPTGLPIGFCGIPCTSPLAPSCETLPIGMLSFPICSSASGLCEECTADSQCKRASGAKGPLCDLPLGGNGDCGCQFDSDCPTGDICTPGNLLGACTHSLSCTPADCGAYFCNWDSGICVAQSTTLSQPSCLTDYDCSHDPGARSPAQHCGAGGLCVECRNNADCIALGYSACSSTSYCNNECNSNADCATTPLPKRTCLMLDAGTGYTPFCACGSDADCAGQAGGTHCDLNLADADLGLFGQCICETGKDCPNGECISHSCSTDCDSDSDCGVDNFCNAHTCGPRCDPGHSCQGDAPVCDVDNLAGSNDGGVIWCYECLQASDCDAGEACRSNSHSCGSCASNALCRPNEVCLPDFDNQGHSVCEATCDAGPCPPGEVCDADGIADYGRFGPYVCFQCLSPIDCPNGEGCNSQTHRCGTCTGPNAANGSFDCPAGSICSNYWNVKGSGSGVCLENCDARSCPADRPICAVLPALDPDDKYCFGCLTDSDCVGADAGTWCDTSVGLTFTCQP